MADDHMRIPAIVCFVFIFAFARLSDDGWAKGCSWLLPGNLLAHHFNNGPEASGI